METASNIRFPQQPIRSTDELHSNPHHHHPSSQSIQPLPFALTSVPPRAPLGISSGANPTTNTATSYYFNSSTFGGAPSNPTTLSSRKHGSSSQVIGLVQNSGEASIHTQEKKSSQATSLNQSSSARPKENLIATTSQHFIATNQSGQTTARRNISPAPATHSEIPTPDHTQRSNTPIIFDSVPILTSSSALPLASTTFVPMPTHNNNNKAPSPQHQTSTRHHGGRNPNKLALRFQNQKLVRSLAEIILGISIVVFIILFLTGATTTFGSLYEAAKGQGLAGITKPSAMRITIKKITEVASLELGNTLLLIVIGYLLLQTFCVPGTVVLNAVIGALLGVGIGLPFGVLLGTAGASCCYTLSSVVGVTLVEAVDNKLMKGKGIGKIRVAVQRYRSDLFVYLLFLRLTPILPNWLVNLGAPVANVPLIPFAAATAVGIIPQTYLTVRFGTLVNALGAISDDPNDPAANTPIVTKWDTLLLAIVACALLLGNRLRKKFAAGTQQQGTE